MGLFKKGSISVKPWLKNTLVHQAVKAICGSVRGMMQRTSFGKELPEITSGKELGTQCLVLTLVSGRGGEVGKCVLTYGREEIWCFLPKLKISNHHWNLIKR